MRKIYIIGATVLLFASCRPSVTVTKTPTPGTADFSNFLAVGDIFTSGFADNSLTVFGQLNSYPQRVFEQFQAIPGSLGARGFFVQPLLHGTFDDLGYPGPKKILSMVYSSCDPTDSAYMPIDVPSYIQDPSDAQFVSGINNGQVNNIAVPGIRVVDYPVQSYAATTNVFANRFYHDPTSTPMKELLFRVNNYHPTFFTLWLGTSDVLAYALGGGQGDGTGHALPTSLNIFAPDAISPLDSFQRDYDSLLNVTIHTSASGALINIPYVTSLPFFNAIPANGLKIDRQTLADSLQLLYSVYKAVFQVGDNYFMIKDHNGHIRQAVPGELILMSIPKDKIKCEGWGTMVPIPEQYVLTTEEIQNIKTATDGYNTFIKKEADLHHLAYVDANRYFNAFTTGVSYNGVNYSAKYVSGGAFSLDGLSLTPRGNALIANETIKVINTVYRSTIQLIDVNKYQGVNFP